MVEEQHKTAENSVLRTENLAVGYPLKAEKKTIVSDINIEFYKGELIGLVGINGSGKSTLLRSLSGLQTPLNGSVFLNDEKLNQISAERRSQQLSVVLTGQQISKNLSVVELVALGRQPYTNWLGNLSKTDIKSINNALAATELQSLKHQKCHTLSDGQLQRALIARALAQDTNLIILDEPTTHLDLHHKASVLILLREISKNTGTTILFSTHDIELIIPLCDKMLVLHEGKCTMDAPQKLVENGVFSRLFPDKIIGFDSETSRFYLKNKDFTDGFLPSQICIFETKPTAMSESYVLLIIGCGALLLGGLIGFLVVNARKNGQLNRLTERLELQALQLQKTERQLQETQDEKNNLLSEISSIQQNLTRRNVELEHLKERMSEKTGELEELQARFTRDFELVANKILDEKSTKFTLQNKENLDSILKPLQEKINSFEKKVEDTNKESLGRHSELRQQIKGLAELNLQMSRDADNLTKALKGDSKMQGNWGEMILTRVLEKSGLEKGREYTLQDSHASENGRRLQTDVLIHLPDGKKMIVDSKVSLTAFERFVSEEDEALKTVHLKQHITSIKRHIDQLSAKNYPYLIDESPDTTFMFIPVEPAFAIASAHAPQLYETAFDKQVIIVTPSTLLAALRLVENLWQNDKQKKNAIEIATQAGNLYDSFSNLTDELLKIERQMGTVQNSFGNALKKLTGKGNLVQRVEKLRRLGAKTSKKIESSLIHSIPQENSKSTDQQDK